MQIARVNFKIKRAQGLVAQQEKERVSIPQRRTVMRQRSRLSLPHHLRVVLLKLQTWMLTTQIIWHKRRSKKRVTSSISKLQWIHIKSKLAAMLAVMLVAAMLAALLVVAMLAAMLKDKCPLKEASPIHHHRVYFKSNLSHNSIRTYKGEMLLNNSWLRYYRRTLKL